jgi:hypothetical protein
VDRIEKLVHRVKSDVNNIETRLDAAEISSGLPSSDLRSFFKPLFAVNNSPQIGTQCSLINLLLQKKTDPTAFPEANLPIYEHPDIFRTEEFFPAVKTEKDQS